MERLFTDKGDYTKRACEIDHKIVQFVLEFAKQYPEVDVRDLSLVIQEAAAMGMVEYRLLTRNER